MRTVLRCLAMAVLLATTFVNKVHAEEEAIPLGKLPRLVLDSVIKAFPKAESILKASKEEGEEEEGKFNYEVTMTEHGKKIDITVDEEGEIELLEKEMKLKELPEAVTNALAKLYPKTTLKSAEAVYELEDGEPELDFYEVQLKPTDGKEVEAKIKANGKVVKEDDREGESGEREENE